MPEGKLIVIEGLDGSGKATQTQRLRDRFVQMGKSHLRISFPDYNHQSSTLVRMYLAGDLGNLHQVNAYAASSFYSVDRFVSYQSIWKKEYQSGHTILADRYTTSNAGHQMAKLPREQWDDYLSWLVDYEYNKMELPKPDMVVYLDMPPEISRTLLSSRYAGDESKKDIHEADDAYNLLCREAALYAAKAQGWQVISCGDDSGPYPVQEIADAIWKLVEPIL